MGKTPRESHRSRTLRETYASRNKHERGLSSAKKTQLSMRSRLDKVLLEGFNPDQEFTLQQFVKIAETALPSFAPGKIHAEARNFLTRETKIGTKVRWLDELNYLRLPTDKELKAREPKPAPPPVTNHQAEPAKEEPTMVNDTANPPELDETPETPVVEPTSPKPSMTGFSRDPMRIMQVIKSIVDLSPTTGSAIDNGQPLSALTQHLAETFEWPVSTSGSGIMNVGRCLFAIVTHTPELLRRTTSGKFAPWYAVTELSVSNLGKPDSELRTIEQLLTPHQQPAPTTPPSAEHTPTDLSEESLEDSLEAHFDRGNAFDLREAAEWLHHDIKNGLRHALRQLIDANKLIFVSESDADLPMYALPLPALKAENFSQTKSRTLRHIAMQLRALTVNQPKPTLPSDAVENTRRDAEFEIARNKVSDLSDRIARMENELIHLTNENERLIAINTELSSQIEQGPTVTINRKSSKSSNTDLSQLQTMLDDRDARIRELEDQVLQLHASTPTPAPAEPDPQVKALLEQLTELQDQLKRKEDWHAAATAHIEKLEVELSGLRLTAMPEDKKLSSTQVDEKIAAALKPMQRQLDNVEEMLNRVSRAFVLK